MGLEKLYGKITRKEHLEQIQKTTGKINHELSPIIIPYLCRRSWEAFWDMNKSRYEYGDLGRIIKPICEIQIFAYSQIHRIVFKSDEIRLIKAFDGIYLNNLFESKDGSGKSSNKDNRAGR